MTGFLAPAALLGLALLAIPIAVHLFKPKEVKRTPFTSLRWLRASEHRLSRRIKWHQLLLFFLRAALVALLVTALAKPFFVTGDRATPADRVVVIDLSRSMGYRALDGSTPLDEAKQVAEQLLSGASPLDRTTVLAADGRPRALGPLTSDASRYVARVRSLVAAASDTDITSALRLVAPLRTPNENRRLELVLITDNRADSWRSATAGQMARELGATLDVSVVEVGPRSCENAYVADARIRESAEGSRIRVRVGAVGTARGQRTVTVSGIAGAGALNQRITLNPRGAVELDFQLPARANLAGQVARVELQPGDALPSDDVFWVNLDGRASTQVLVIEPPSSAIAELESGFHLRVALDALAQASPGGLHNTSRAPADVRSADLESADAVFMVDVPSLSTAVHERLRDRVSAGAGLVVFLGPSIEPDFYNRVLHDPLRPSQSLLALTLGNRIEQPKSRPPLGIAAIDWQHPLFAGLEDPVYGDLTRSVFWRHHRVELAGTGAATLAKLGDDVPAIVEQSLGAGKVIFFNTTASDAWSDLPRRKSFVPVVDRLLSYLTARTRGTFRLGDVVLVPLRSGEASETVVRAPSAKTLQPVVRSYGGLTMLELADLVEPGPYWVEPRAANASRFPFVVQAGGADSLLEPADREKVSAWWSPARCRVISADDPALAALRKPAVPLEAWLLVAACGSMLAEMFFVHWFCPKASPKIATTPLMVTGRLGSRPEDLPADSDLADEDLSGASPIYSQAEA